MRRSLHALPAGRGFWPLLLCQFCAALGENTLKSALAILLLWALPIRWAGAGVAVAGATLVLPFLFGSLAAGRLADRRDRAGLARTIKACELGCTLLAAVGLALGGPVAMPALLFAALLGYGMCATAFGPVKYALLPDHLPAPMLPAANAAVESSTFLAILAGTFAGGLNGSALALGGARLTLGAGLFAVALVALVAAWAIPPAPPPSRTGRDGVAARLPTGAVRDGPPALLPALLGGTWFWLAGSVAMALLPVLVRQAYGGDARSTALALGAFALGVTPGAALAALWQGGHIRFAPAIAGAAGLGLAMLDLWRRAPLHGAIGAHGAAWPVLLSRPGAGAALADLVAMAACAGLLGVPAASILQAASPPAQRARLVGLSNMLSAAAMVGGALALATAQAAGLEAATLFGLTGGLGLAVTLGLAYVVRARLGAGPVPDYTGMP